jgi:hypothetical protein
MSRAEGSFTPPGGMREPHEYWECACEVIPTCAAGQTLVLPPEVSPALANPGKGHTPDKSLEVPGSPSARAAPGDAARDPRRGTESLDGRTSSDTSAHLEVALDITPLYCRATLRERSYVPSDRFARFLSLAGVFAGLLLAGGLTLTYSIPNSETSFDETFSWWQDNRGQHQISGLLLAPLVALMLIFFGAGLQRSLRSNNRDSGHGSVAFGGAMLGAAGFALIGMLEAAAANAAHEGHEEAVYALSQLHSYDWLAFNASWAAVLLATGLGARRNGMLPSALAWATIVLGATQLTPIGFLGSLLIPPWLIVVGIWLFRTKADSREQVAALGDNVASSNP